MAQNYNIPGVYVKEVSQLASSIARDAATVPLFIGLTREHTKNMPVPTGAGESAPPYLVRSYEEYVQVFGGPKAENFEAVVTDTTVGGSVQRKIVVTHKPGPNTVHIMGYAIQLYFANGGGPCKVLSTGLAYTTGQQVDEYWMTKASLLANREDGCNLVLVPDLVNVAGGVGVFKDVAKLFLDKVMEHGGKFMLLDVPRREALAPGSTVTDSISQFRTLAPGLHLKHGAAYFPYVATTLRYAYEDATVTVLHTKDGNVQPSNGQTLAQLGAAIGNDALCNEIRSQVQAIPVVLPPSGAVAGQMTRNDRERGLWKATANVSLDAVIRLVDTPLRTEEEWANVDAQGGLSVNLIKNMPGRGNVIWGARTLDGNSPEWRYIPVRRLFTMVERAIARGSEWAVFESNDANTWLRLKSMIEAYLTGLWRDGALQGAKPQQAFFVNVGLGSTMSQRDLLDGILRIEVGLAAARPAEFIVLRISQMMQQS